ncbi:hypothetical protein [Streptomyces odontomachi]|uniref:hypothetical protein n=1 Tax=Streptomyces odontomachi TaxID=2944940 RepID=UPI00210D026E|nr:hypothetical protein [Streptomyces sp. ODS25]
MTETPAPVLPRPMRVLLAPQTVVLLRLYPGERYEDVLARAMRMLATADGLVDTTGRPKRRQS